MDELVANLHLAVADSIAEIDWMGEETKAQALEKLARSSLKYRQAEIEAVGVDEKTLRA